MGFVLDGARYLTVEDLADMGFHPEVQRSWRKKRAIPFRRVGKRILYREEDMAAFIERHHVQSLDELREGL